MKVVLRMVDLMIQEFTNMPRAIDMIVSLKMVDLPVVVQSCQGVIAVKDNLVVVN